MGSGERGLPEDRYPTTWLSWIAVITVPLVSIVTAVLVHIGPPGQQISNPPGLWPDQSRFAISEPTDRFILIIWWLLPILLVVAGRLLAAPVQRKMNSLWVHGLVVGLALCSVTLILLAVLLPAGETDWWRGIGVTGALGGLAMTLGIVLGWFTHGVLRLFLVFGVLGISAAWLFPALISTPDHIRNTYDFMFTSDELAAPAVGAFPLGGFTAQYVNLLGYPIAPILHLVPGSATDVVVAWIVVLQVAAIAAALGLSVLAGGRRVLPGAFAVIAAPLVVAGVDSRETSLTYFATVPLRVVLPVLLLLFLAWTVRRTSHPSAVAASILGVGAGITALNNADFGGPALIAVLITLVLLSTTWIRRIAVTAGYCAGAIAIPIVYGCLLVVSGNEFDPSAYLAYARIFGVNGFYQIPMVPFGLHVLAVALFTSATAIGVWRLLSRRGSTIEGAVMAAAGSWALLTMTYFSGRSLLPTLVGGTAFQVGLVTATLLPSFLRTIQRLRTVRSVTTLSSVLVSGVMIVSVTGLMFTGRPPKDSLVDAIDSASGRPSVRHEVLKSNIGPGQPGDVFLIRQGALSQLEVGWPSGLVVNNPEAFMISPYFTTKQCRALAGSRWTAVIIDADLGEYLARDPACQALLNFDEVQEVGMGARVPRSRG